MNDTRINSHSFTFNKHNKLLQILFKEKNFIIMVKNVWVDADDIFKHFFYYVLKYILNNLTATIILISSGYVVYSVAL